MARPNDGHSKPRPAVTKNFQCKFKEFAPLAEDEERHEFDTFDRHHHSGASHPGSGLGYDRFHSAYNHRNAHMDDSYWHSHRHVSDIYHPPHHRYPPHRPTLSHIHSNLYPDDYNHPTSRWAHKESYRWTRNHWNNNFHHHPPHHPASPIPYEHEIEGMNLYQQHLHRQIELSKLSKLINARLEKGTLDPRLVTNIVLKSITTRVKPEDAVKILRHLTSTEYHQHPQPSRDIYRDFSSKYVPIDARNTIMKKIEDVKEIRDCGCSKHGHKENGECCEQAQAITKLRQILENPSNFDKDNQKIVLGKILEFVESHGCAEEIHRIVQESIKQ